MVATLVSSYTTVPLVHNVVPALGSNTNLTSAMILNVAGRVEAKMNAKLSRRYVMPLTVPSPLLTTIASELTAYSIVVQQLFIAQKLADSPWPGRLKEVETLLEELASGELALIDSSGQIVSQNDADIQVWSNTMDYIPTFSELDFTEAFLDQNKVDDQRQDRGLNIDVVD